MLLDLAVAPVKMTAAEVGRAFWWRYGPAGKDPEARGYKTRAHTFAGVGRRPFAPVHLTARRTARATSRSAGSGGPGSRATPGRTMTATCRSARRSSDTGSRSATAGALVRGWTVTGATSTTYTAAQQAADAIAAPFKVRVQQISETYGRGARAEVEFTG